MGKMIVNCYAVLDSKMADFQIAIFDIKHEGAIRQFSDVINEKRNNWHKHPEDYSLWYVGNFDSTKGMLEGVIPENLVNAVAVMSLNKPQLDLFGENGEKTKEAVVN